VDWMIQFESLSKHLYVWNVKRLYEAGEVVCSLF
jgi:hypothetical protein